MLVLHRKESESVSFPGLGIVIKVLKCAKGFVRFGVTCTKKRYKVLRDELRRRKPRRAEGDAGAAGTEGVTG